MSKFAVQASLYSVLSADVDLIALGPEIVDFGRSADDGSSIFPYVEIGTIIFNEWDTKSTDGFDATFRIHAYSNSGSSKETLLIQDAIYSALHNTPLQVAGFNSINFYRQQSDVMRTSSGAFHGVCEYRGLFDQT